MKKKYWEVRYLYFTSSSLNIYFILHVQPIYEKERWKRIFDKKTVVTY